MASRIAKTPLVQFQRQLAAQAAPAATIKKSAASEGIEVRVTYVIHYLRSIPYDSKTRKVNKMS